MTVNTGFRRSRFESPMCRLTLLAGIEAEGEAKIEGAGEGVGEVAARLLVFPPVSPKADPSTEGARKSKTFIVRQ